MNDRLDLVNAIEPRAVNWELVTPGSNDDERMSNAKYSISIARKVTDPSHVVASVTVIIDVIIIHVFIRCRSAPACF